MSVYNLNRTQIAALFGKNLSTIDKWVREGMPYLEKGSKGSGWVFDVSNVINWREKKLREDVNTLERIELDEAKRRKMAAEAGILEIDLQMKRRKAVLLADVEQTIAHAYLTIKQRLRTIPERIVPQLMNEGSQRICCELISNEIDDALLELSQLDFDGDKTE